jgi:hypothetical protein
MLEGLQSFWPLEGNYENIGAYRDMIPHGNIDISEDGARLHTGDYLEFRTRDISQGFTYLIDIEVAEDHISNDYIHFMTEYNDQLNFTFKMTSPGYAYPMYPYVYRRYQQTVTHCTQVQIFKEEKHIMCVRYDGSEISIYVDGNRCLGNTLDGDIPWTRFRIGNWNGEGFSGMVRSVALYERDLSDDEIASVTQAMIAQRIES